MLFLHYKSSDRSLNEFLYKRPYFELVERGSKVFVLCLRHRHRVVMTLGKIVKGWSTPNGTIITRVDLNLALLRRLFMHKGINFICAVNKRVRKVFARESWFDKHFYKLILLGLPNLRNRTLRYYRAIGQSRKALGLRRYCNFLATLPKKVKQ